VSDNSEVSNLYIRYKKTFQEIWNLISDFEEIAIYGCGDGLLHIIDCIDVKTKNVVCIIDNSDVHNPIFNGIPVVSINSVSKYRFKKIILTGFNSRFKMRQDINNFDLAIEVIDIYNVLRERGEEYKRPYFEYAVKNKQSIFLLGNACSSFDVTSAKDLLDDDTWKGFGLNTGNILMNEYFKRPLVNMEFVESINEAGHIVALMANWLRPHECDYSFWYRILDQYSDKPITMLGLGAQSNLSVMKPKEYIRTLDPHQIRIMSMVAERGEIGVRGYFTAEVLREIGVSNVAVIGCPSYYKNGYNQPLISKKAFAYDLKAVFTTFWGGTSREELSIMKAMRAFCDSKHILQMERDFIPFWLASKTGAGHSEELIAEFCTLTSTPRNEYKLEMMDIFEIFTNIEKWEEFIKSRDFLIGNRIHATILALKCGIPSIIITPDSRTLEMAELFKIPHVRSDAISDNDLEIKKLYDFMDFRSMEEEYPKLLRRYMEFLVKRDIAFNPNRRKDVIEDQKSENTTGIICEGLK